MRGAQDPAITNGSSPVPHGVLPAGGVGTAPEPLLWACGVCVTREDALQAEVFKAVCGFTLVKTTALPPGVKTPLSPRTPAGLNTRFHPCALRGNDPALRAGARFPAAPTS